jgi:cystathionine beta-lyase/cystathionine gamma-synthase
MRRRTQEVHAGREDLTALGVHAPPLDLSTTYPLPDAAQGTAAIDALASGQLPTGSPVYARLHNPTVGRFEQGLAALEGAQAAVAFGSGMAALTAVLLASKGAGDHVVAVRPLYGGSDHLLASELLGLRVVWAEADQIAHVVCPGTALVLIETPANPTLALVDIAQVVADAGDVPVLVDSTFATPVLQRPLEHGAAYVLHSATKFLGGHGDVIGGVIACSEARAQPLRQVRIATGALLHPLAGYLLHRGLQTLGLRVRAAQSNAQLLVERLAQHPAVQAVHYPSGPLLGRQMDGPGSLIAFSVQDVDQARFVMAQLSLITPAVSLGSVDTLIQHPAGLTHRIVSEEGRQAGKVSGGLLRLSVGIEDPEDLWTDLERALRPLSGAAAAK